MPLQLLPSRLRQSKPSTRTVAGKTPNLVWAQPCLGDMGGPDRVSGEVAKSAGGWFSPNRASWTTGLAARLGGEPQKNGGDVAN